jgi:argininosuccinate synthase
VTRILLAYSGGLHSSLALARLVERPGTEVVTITVDLGQGPGVAAARERALGLGAVRAHAIDARQTFATAVVLPALQAGLADHHAASPPVRALTSAGVVPEMRSIAAVEQASAMACGCRSGTAGDRIWTGAMTALLPDLEIVQTARRAEASDAAQAEARRRGVPRGADDELLWASRNLWGCSAAYPSGDSREVPASGLASPGSSSRPSVTVSVEFAAGSPVAINGVPLALVDLIEALDTLASGHQVGRAVVLVREPDGTTARATDDAPAMALLGAAYRALRCVAWEADLNALTAPLTSVHAELVARGDWFSASRRALTALFGAAQAPLTGTVTIALSYRTCEVVSVDLVSTSSGSRRHPDGAASLSPS